MCYSELLMIWRVNSVLTAVVFLWMFLRYSVTPLKSMQKCCTELGSKWVSLYGFWISNVMFLSLKYLNERGIAESTGRSWAPSEHISLCRCMPLRGWLEQNLCIQENGISASVTGVLGVLLWGSTGEGEFCGRSKRVNCELLKVGVGCGVVGLVFCLVSCFLCVWFFCCLFCFVGFFLVVVVF